MIEKAQTASMMAMKSRVEMMIWHRGDAKVLGPVTFIGAMILGPKGFGGAEEAGAVGNGVMVAGVGTEDSGI